MTNIEAALAEIKQRLPKLLISYDHEYNRVLIGYSVPGVFGGSLTVLVDAFVDNPYIGAMIADKIRGHVAEYFCGSPTPIIASSSMGAPVDGGSIFPIATLHLDEWDSLSGPIPPLTEYSFSGEFMSSGSAGYAYDHGESHCEAL